MPSKTLTVGGIDPSSKKIVIVATDRTRQRKPFIHSTELDADRIEDRQLQAFDFIFQFCMGVRERTGQPPVLYLEAPVMGVGGPGATIPQAFVEGSIMASAAQADAKITLVNNQSWKKLVLGSGATPKDKIGPWVELNWKALYDKTPIMRIGQFKGRPDQDVLDAGCINLFGWKRVLLLESLTKRHQKEFTSAN